MSIAACPRKKLLPVKEANCIVSLKRQGPAANPALGKSLALGYLYVMAS